jgi:hypothetical protein
MAVPHWQGCTEAAVRSTAIQFIAHVHKQQAINHGRPDARRVQTCGEVSHSSVCTAGNSPRVLHARDRSATRPAQRVPHKHKPAT